MHYKDAKKDLERALLKLMNLGPGYTGVTLVKISWREGVIMAGITKEQDGERFDWHRLSDMK